MVIEVPTTAPAALAQIEADAAASMVQSTAAPKPSGADVTRNAPNLTFSHFGITVRDSDRMVRFYRDVLGFVETDRGPAAGVHFVFLTRDPGDHHQIALVTGKPENIPLNTLNPHMGAAIQHISFKMSTLDDLRDIVSRLEEGGATNVHPVTHGVMWAVYAHDPEGNMLEFHVYSDYYIEQPFLVPIDFSQSNDEIIAANKVLCEQSKRFEALGSWRERVSKQITPFVDSAS